MRIIIYYILLFFTLSSSGCVGLKEDTDTLFQVSTINALLNGAYHGSLAIGSLKRHGTFGIGTFDALDGEMIGLEGRFYQIRADGIAYPVPDSMTTPFAVVTHFETDKTVFVRGRMDYEGLTGYLDEQTPDKNIFYAIKVVGTFKYMRVRSVPRQKQPYPPLVEAVKDQTIFEFHDIKGTIVGFRCPDSVKGGVNVPGYHFHFITEGRKAGGHLLACQLQEGTIAIDYTSHFHLVLPQQDNASSQSLPNKDRTEELKKVEGK
ncbi:MAG: alpha-acetolactate decarboxylase [Deltaproteobacteria bacterium RBG_16_54_11]|nr:MAG: alpha-acetolactate decarboxylase [Deltaproteobacteria bacterium RBG_16_54_11]